MIDYTEIRDDRIRGKICELMSEMLDNPDKHGIYPTSRFMWKAETFILAEIERLRTGNERLKMRVREQTTQTLENVKQMSDAVLDAVNRAGGWPPDREPWNAAPVEQRIGTLLAMRDGEIERLQSGLRLAACWLRGNEAFDGDSPQEIYEDAMRESQSRYGIAETRGMFPLKGETDE